MTSGKGAHQSPCSGYVWVNGWFVFFFSTFTYVIQIFLCFCLKEQWSQEVTKDFKTKVSMAQYANYLNFIYFLQLLY